MKLLLVVMALSSSCVVPTLQNNCGLMLAGDFGDRFGRSWIDDQQLSNGMNAAIKAASYITDLDFMDQTQNCRALGGFRIYTRNTQTFFIQGKRQVYAYTTCQLKMIVLGRPPDGRWQSSSLVHQLYHVMQNCKGKLPIDQKMFRSQQDNEDHANWSRDHIWFAIDEANKEK